MSPAAAKRFTLPWPPSGNHYKAPHPRGRGYYVTREAQAYRRAVALLCARMRPLPGLVQVELRFYRGESRGRLVRGDLDNLEKVLLDCLQGRAYENDARIRRKLSELHEDRCNPRVEVLVEPYCCDADEAEATA